MLSAVSSLLTNVSDLPELPDLSNLTSELTKAVQVISGFIQAGESSNYEIAETINSTVTKISNTYTLILAGFFLVIGILACLLGYKLSRLFMAITGFTAGLAAGTIIGARFIHGSNFIVLACAIAGAILLSLFSFKIYQAGIFVLCFFLTFILCANYIPATGNLAFFLCTLGGFIVGVLALKFVRPVIILASAFSGAHFISESMIKLGPKFDIPFFEETYAPIVIFLAAFLIGTLIQFLTTRDPNGKKKRKKKERY